MDNDEAARIIQNFYMHSYKRKVAENTRNAMFSSGILYQSAGTPDYINTMMNSNVNRFNLLRMTLTPLESAFFYRFMATEFFATHATNSINAIDKEGNLILYSHRKLQEKNIEHTVHDATNGDIDTLGNDNYVFFSLEAGATLQKRKSRFGNIFYRIKFNNYNFNYADISLVDSLLAWPYHRPGPFRGLPFISSAGMRHIFNVIESFNRITIHFTNTPIKNALQFVALSLIYISQGLSDKDKNHFLTIYSDTDVNKLMNTLFRPEIRVPVMAAFKYGQYQLSVLPSR